MADKSGITNLSAAHRIDSVDKPTFEWILQHYSSSPLMADDGSDLDDVRYRIIPEAVKDRNGDSFLTKDELVTLVTWKLKHGTFRPTLQALVKQNDAKVVENTTRQAFVQYDQIAAKDALKTLATLRGIGPATASLVLSVYDPNAAPFFSDELFRWALFESGKGKGWDRQIKYTAKEYAELRDRIADLSSRLGVSAVDAEKVAYTLGKGLVPTDTGEVESKGAGQGIETSEKKHSNCGNS